MKTWVDKIICKICGKEVSKCSLSSHLKWSHNKMTYKEYFDTYEEAMRVYLCDESLSIDDFEVIDVSLEYESI